MLGPIGSVRMFEIAVIAVVVASLLGAGLLVLREKHRADRRLRDAISVLPAGLALFDAADRLYLWNKPYEEVSGAALSRLRPGVRFREMLEADLANKYYIDGVGREQAWLDERLAARARGDQSIEQDIGGGRWLRVEDRRTSDGGIASICTDITELKRREGSFKLLFESNPVPMWLWEGSRTLPILDMNQAAREHLGYSAREIEGLTVFDVLSEEDWPSLHEMIRTGVYQSYDGERVWNPRRADGEQRRALPYIQLLPDTDGRGRFIGAIVDVTERIAAEDALRNTADSLAIAKEEAEAANRAKSEFLANMSHELRTPLNGVVGMADLLARGDLSDREREMVEIIRASGATLERLLGDVLDLVGIEAGRVSIDPRPFALGETVRATGNLFDFKAQEKGVGFHVEVSPDAEQAFLGDAVRVKQILGNLVSNAIKFTDAGAVTLSATVEPGGVRLTVRDTGVGFDPADKDRIFGRFEQADGSITRKFGGSGLGLSISRQLAELMGGTIEADSTPGAGSVFTVTLPLALAPEALAATPAPSPDDAEPRALRILLADDHPTNRKVVELILAGAEVDLTSVGDGLQALEAYQAAPFDVVLMDMQMPVMDGLTATTRIREHEASGGLAHAPVIMLTANALPEHVRAAHAAGVDRHLAKPVTAEGLITAISETMDRVAEAHDAAAA
jgi:PAS domain S-box-containing protein